MIYLDNAATTYPKPEEVYEQSIRFMKEGAGNPGRGSHHFSTASALVVENTRRQVARFFGVTDHRRVVFTYNCTDSINIVLKGFLQPHEHVIATHLDHNSVSRPLESIVQEKQLQLTRLPFEPGGEIDPIQYADAVRENTALIILNHGSNVLGSVQKKELFLREGIPVLLDAAQTAGRIPIALENYPVFLACSAHKSLFGMPGLGILIVPQNVKLTAWREGGSGTASEELQHPVELPMHLEAGTPNFLSIAALSHGLTFIEKEGMAKIHRKEWGLARILFESLLSDSRFQVYSRLAEQDLAVIAFNVRNIPPDEVAVILDQRFGIAIRSGLHCAAVLHQQLNTLPAGCLRVSPGYFNTEEDIRFLIQALQSIVEGYE